MRFWKTLLIAGYLCLNSAAAGSAFASTLSVKVDPRIELLGVVDLLSGGSHNWGGGPKLDYSYKSDVLKYFTQYKDHRVVSLYTEMSNADFTYDAPPTVMLHLSKLPCLELETPLDDMTFLRAGGRERLMEFLDALRDFSTQTKFVEFFKAHEPAYDSAVARVQVMIKGNDEVSTLENYFGTKCESYNLILAFLYSPGHGYGPRLEGQGGKGADVFIVYCPMGTEGGLPAYGDPAILRYMILHEFGHSFVNPVSDLFRSQLDLDSTLLRPIKALMQQQAYGNWIACVNEHLLRAFTTRLTCRSQSADSCRQTIKAELRHGFVYLEPLCRGLERYEETRDSFPTFKDFYPQLVAVFDGLKAEGAADRFPGIIGNVFLGNSSTVLITPTNESDSTAQRKIQELAVMVRDKALRGGTILTDKEGLAQDLSQKSIIVFGTPSGNLWLAGIMNKLPFKIQPDKIVADTAYSGTHLRYITAWPNPHNAQLGMVIFTAQTAADIAQIARVFPKLTDDYAVANGDSILKSAFYKKDGSTWSF